MFKINIDEFDQDTGNFITKEININEKTVKFFEEIKWYRRFEIKTHLVIICWSHSFQRESTNKNTYDIIKKHCINFIEISKKDRNRVLINKDLIAMTEDTPKGTCYRFIDGEGFVFN